MTRSGTIWKTAPEPTTIEQLYAGFYAPLVHWLSNRYTCGRMAEDIAQEALLRAWQKGVTFQTAGQAKSWLWTTAKNLLISALRHEKPQLLVPIQQASDPATAPDEATRDQMNDLGIQHVAVDPIDYVEVVHQQMEILDLLDHVSDRYRPTFVRHLLGAGTEEEAEILGASRSQAKKFVFFARTEIRELAA